MKFSDVCTLGILSLWLRHTSHLHYYLKWQFAILKNSRLVCLLDLTADFGVKTNAKLTPIFKLRERESKTGIQSCLYTGTNPVSIFAQIFWRIFSNIQFFCSKYVLYTLVNKQSVFNGFHGPRCTFTPCPTSDSFSITSSTPSLTSTYCKLINIFTTTTM